MPSTSVTFNVGQGKFDVELELLDKYPDSLLSKCVRNSNIYEEDQSFNIDRDGRYFAKVLSFMRNTDSLAFRRMSNIDMDILKAEAHYLNIEELVVSIDNYRMPKKFGYDEVELVKDMDSLSRILADEITLTRYFILLNYEEYIAREDGLDDLKNILPAIDRNRCLVLALLFKPAGLQLSSGAAEGGKSYLYDALNSTLIAIESYKVSGQMNFYSYITMTGIRFGDDFYLK